MRNWMLDFFDWVFMQSGFSWREWRELCISARQPKVEESAPEAPAPFYDPYFGKYLSDDWVDNGYWDGR